VCVCLIEKPPPGTVVTGYKLDGDADSPDDVGRTHRYIEDFTTAAGVRADDECSNTASTVAESVDTTIARSRSCPPQEFHWGGASEAGT
jgi:hypothetical protein